VPTNAATGRLPEVVADPALRQLLARQPFLGPRPGAPRAPQQVAGGQGGIGQEFDLVVPHEHDQPAAGSGRFRLQSFQEQDDAHALLPAVQQVADHEQDLARPLAVPGDAPRLVDAQPGGDEELLELAQPAVDVTDRPEHVVASAQLLRGNGDPGIGRGEDRPRVGPRRAARRPQCSRESESSHLITIGRFLEDVTGPLRMSVGAVQFKVLGLLALLDD